MGYGSALVCRWFGSAYIHTAINQGGVDGDDFRRNYCGDLKRGSGLTGRGGSHDRNRKWFYHATTVRFPIKRTERKLSVPKTAEMIASGYKVPL
jgi:hypothetical protein